MRVFSLALLTSFLAACSTEPAVQSRVYQEGAVMVVYSSPACTGAAWDYIKTNKTDLALRLEWYKADGSFVVHDGTNRVDSVEGCWAIHNRQVLVVFDGGIAFEMPRERFKPVASTLPLK